MTTAVGPNVCQTAFDQLSSGACPATGPFGAEKLSASKTPRPFMPVPDTPIVGVPLPIDRARAVHLAVLENSHIK